MPNIILSVCKLLKQQRWQQLDATLAEIKLVHEGQLYLMLTASHLLLPQVEQNNSIKRNKTLFKSSIVLRDLFCWLLSFVQTENLKMDNFDLYFLRIYSVFGAKMCTQNVLGQLMYLLHSNLLSWIITSDFDHLDILYPKQQKPSKNLYLDTYFQELFIIKICMY